VTVRASAASTQPEGCHDPFAHAQPSDRRFTGGGCPWKRRAVRLGRYLTAFASTGPVEAFGSSIPKKQSLKIWGSAGDVYVAGLPKGAVPDASRIQKLRLN
jgi:hypothetical protein